MQEISKITSLEELQNARRELELTHKVTKREIVHNFGTTTTNFKDFLLKRVALPVGAGAAAIYGISKLTKDDHEETVMINGRQVRLETGKREHHSSGFAIAPLLLGIGKLLLDRYKQDRMVDAITEQTVEAVREANDPSTPAPTVASVTPAQPIAGNPVSQPSY